MAFLFVAALAAGCACAKPERPDIVPTERTGAAIQRAIDAAAEAGGGRVVVSPGIWPSGSLRLRSNVELHLAKGARIVGGTTSEGYFSFPEDVCSIRPERSSRVFIYAWDEHDIAITGEGTIDGQGPKFFDHSTRQFERFWAKPPCERPRMVQLVRCRNVRLNGTTFLDSPGWTMLIRLCENVDADGIRVQANQMIINSDGIDFDSCRHVRVRNSDFVTGDDSIIMRAMREKGCADRIVCEDVLVENCRLNSACQCIRMGCPSDDTIRNVTFRDLRLAGFNGIYFNNPVGYLRSGDEGYLDVHDVLFENVTGSLEGSAIQIDVDPGIRLRGVRDITFRNVDVQSKEPLRFVGNVHTRFERVRFENVTVNGLRQDDGDVPGDFTADGPLVRRKSKSWEAQGNANDVRKAVRIRSVAHRGLPGPEAPQNSVAAFKAAYAAGAKQIETDFHWTADGRLLCVHGPKEIKSLAGVSCNIGKLTETDVAAIDIGKKAKTAHPVRMPYVEDVLAVVPKDAIAQCEIKRYGGNEYADKFDAARRAAGLSETNIIVTSFNIRWIAHFKKRYPKYKTGWLECEVSKPGFDLQKSIEKAKAAGCDIFCPGAKYASKSGFGVAEADRVRAAGLDVRLFGVNSPELLEYAARIRATAFTTDHWKKSFEWAKAVPNLVLVP